MRWRNMFWLTGLPGWMRFGYSPGWGGIPPGAAYWGYRAWPAAWYPWGTAPSREDELQILSEELRELEEELRWIKERLEELTREKR